MNEQFELYAQQDPEQASLPAKGPSVWVWLAAVLLMLFGLFMLIPAGLNTVLGADALRAFGYELAGDYERAFEAYAANLQLERQLEEWAQDNFSFGASEAPGFTTNHFGFARSIGMTGRMHGPLRFWQMEIDRQMGGQQPLLYAFDRMPRALYRFAVQVDTIGLIVNGVLEADGEAETMLDLVRALDIARQQDPYAAERRLFYDALALQWLVNYDPASDEAGRRLQVLQQAEGVQRWMYAEAAVARARELEDFALLAELSEQDVAHNHNDFVAMQRHVRALFLAGQTEQAHQTAQDYANQYEAMREVMQLLQAEFYYREGRFAEAMALTQSLIDAQPEEETGNEVYMEARAVQAIVYLLQERADDAFALLHPYLVDEEAGPTVNLFYAALVATVVAEELEFLDSIFPQEYWEEDLSPTLLALLDGETTVQAIFTEGWGGLDI